MPLIKTKTMDLHHHQPAGRPRHGDVPRAPLDNDAMLALFDYLEDCLDFGPCAHDLSHTEAFLVGLGHPPAPAVAWLERLGASCDCEILDRLELTWSAEDEAPAPTKRAPRGDA